MMDKHPKLAEGAARRRALLAVGLGVALAVAGAGVSAQAGTGSGAGPARAAGSRPASHPGAFLTAAQRRAGTWKLLPAAPATAKPFITVSVWTGREMIIHGLTFPTHGRFTLAYHPGTRTWTRLARGPAWVSVESGEIAVSTGSRMLVIGLTNGSYSPAVNRWTPVPSPGQPTSGVLGWTGHQLIMWGGSCCGGGSDTGEAYSPATRTWHMLPASPLHSRSDFSGAWTGKELVVAGGIDPGPSRQRALRDGAAYNPVTRTWRKIAPMPRDHSDAAAVWDGKEILFIGGWNGLFGLPVIHGLAYNPRTNRWRWLPAMQYPRYQFAAVWTGRQLLVWGGLRWTPADTPPPRGEAYNPATNSWTALPAAPLRGRANPVAVWTGRQLIVWGGYSATGTTFTDGAAYTP